MDWNTVRECIEALESDVRRCNASPRFLRLCAQDEMMAADHRGFVVSILDELDRTGITYAPEAARQLDCLFKQIPQYVISFVTWRLTA